jgi:hypothetical protein
VRRRLIASDNDSRREVMFGKVETKSNLVRIAVAAILIGAWSLLPFLPQAEAQTNGLTVTTGLPFSQTWTGTQNMVINVPAAPPGTLLLWVSYVDGVGIYNSGCGCYAQQGSGYGPVQLPFDTTKVSNGQHVFYINVTDFNSGAEYGTYGPVNFTTNNGHAQMQLRANYNELWLTPGQSVQLLPKMAYTDNTSAPLAATSTVFTSKASSVVTVDGSGNVFAAGLGNSSITLTYGNFSDTVLVHVNAQNNTPHFGNDGSQLTGYVPNKSMFVRSMFFSLNGNLPQYAGPFHAAQVNTLESGFFPALDNYGSSTSEMTRWQGQFNYNNSIIQNAANDGFNILLTGDDIARGDAAVYNVSRGPSTLWPTRPLTYAFNWAKQLGKIVGVEMVDEIGFSYTAPFPHGQLGQSGGPQSISCVSDVCTVNWPSPYEVVNGAHTFLITGATSNVNLNRAVNNLYHLTNFITGPNGSEVSFMFNASGVGTQTFTSSTDPNLTVEMFAYAPDGPNGTDYVHSDAFQSIMTDINAVSGHPSITWPDPAAASPANFAAWGADPKASDYADIYIATLYPAYPDRTSLSAQLGSMNSGWNGKYPVVQKNRPTFMIYGLTGPGYGIQGAADPVASMTNDTVTFANPHGITTSNLNIGVTRFSITGNSNSALNGNYYVYQVVDPYTVKAYKEIATTGSLTWGPTVTFSDGTTLNMVGNYNGNMSNETYDDKLGFVGTCYNIGPGQAGMAATVSSTDASFSGKWYVDPYQSGVLATQQNICSWTISMRQLPSGSGTGGTASIIYDNYYHPGVSPIFTPGSPPGVIAASIMYVAEKGGAGVRGYIFASDPNQDQAADRLFKPSDGGIQAAANPLYGDPDTLARWQGMSNAYNLINNIEPYLLQPKLNSPDYGPFMVTTARTSSYGNMLMMTNFSEGTDTETVDFSEYNPTGKTATMRRMTGSSLTSTVVSGTSQQVSFQPGETIVWTFDTSQGPVISSVTSTGITSTSATITWVTDQSSDSQAAYGLTSSYGSTTAINSTQVTSHSMILTGLTPGTTYHYQVLSRNSGGSPTSSGDFTLTTIAVNQAVSLNSLVCSPSSLTGPATSSCTVSLSAAAPAGGTTVSLLSDNSSAIVPLSISVPSGSTSATFSVTAAAVSATQSATLSAALGASSLGTALSLLPPGGAPVLLTSVACNPSSLETGAFSTCTVILNGTAPGGGAAVGLTSGTSALTVPSSVTVPAGASSTTFTAAAGTVTATQTVAVTASVGGNSLTNSLVLNPAGGTPLLKVGPNQTYSTPCQAFTAAPDGAIIQLDAAGAYAGDVCTINANNITVKGINGRPKIDAAGQNAAGKGTWVFEGNNITVDTVELMGALAPNNKGAGIRMEGQNLTVLSSYIHDNQEGILTNPNPVGQILIQSTEFNHNGFGDGLTHNLYIDSAARLILQYSYSHNGNSGHLAETAASENYILYNRLTSESGTTDLAININNGGRSFVVGNLIEKASTDQGNSLLGYLLGGANANNPSTELYVVNNTFVNDQSTGINFLNISSADPTPALVTNNIFYGPGTITTQSHSILNTNLTTNPLFVNQAGYNYHLTSASPAIDAGTDPGTGDAVSLMPLYEYADPACGEVRSLVGIVDIGAYEFGGAGGQLPCSALALSSLNLSPSTVTGGAVTTANTVILSNPAPSPGIVVTLASSNTGVATTPPIVSIPAGATTASFNITTTSVPVSTNATIAASYSGTTQTATLTVVASPALSSVQCSPTTLPSGAASTCTVTLSGAAPAGGAAVSLSSSSGLLTTPVSVTVPAGSASTTFSATAGIINSNQAATVTVTLGGVSRSAILNLAAAAVSVSVSSLACGLTSLASGATTTCTVTLSGGAPAGGTTVTVSSDNALLTTPASVNVTAGSSSTTFTVSAGNIATNQTATVSATLSGVSKGATLQLMPLPDFSISASPASQTVARGSSVNYNTAVTPQLGFNGNVTFSATGLPAGATASFNPASVTGGASSSMTVTAGAATPLGGYTITITGSSGSLTHSAQVTAVVVAPVAAGVSFSQADAQTQGSWKGVYGADGFSVANDVTSYPGYAQVALSGQQPATWAASTTDVRAPQKGAPAATDRIASTWVSNSNFNIDLNLMDGNWHRVSFYCLDWDRQNRSERFDIIDLSNNTVLDSRNISGFGNGQYLIWNLRGNVRVRVTYTGTGANAVVSGFFFDPSAPDFSISASPGSQTVGQGQSTSYTATVTPLLGFNGSLTFSATGLPAGATASFNPASVSGGSSTTMTVTAGAATPPGPYTITITGSSGSLTHSMPVTAFVAMPVAAGVSFSQADIQTQGSWKGVYGADGFSIAGDVTSYPAYAQVTLSGQQSTTWAASTSDVRAVQKGAPAATDRIAATWLSNSNFNIDLNLVDGNWHRVGFYCLDWDRQNRSERFDIIDLSNNTVLDSRNISGFGNGQYLIWNLRGNVRVRVTYTSAGANAVVSGFFFDPPSAPDFSISVSPGSQTVGQGRSTIYTATVTSQVAFNGNVTFSATGLPAGATASFNPASVSGGGSTTMTLTAGSGTPTGTYTITVIGSSGSLTHSTQVTAVVVVPAAAGASFSQTDSQTQGTWKGVYGADGFAIANDVTSYPGYAQVALSGQQSATWATSTTDVRAPQKGASAATDRIASTWVSNSNFNIDLNLVDGNWHRVGFYCLDWDRQNRSERFDIIDLSNNTVLDSRTISGFGNGQYLIWNLRGNVRVRVTYIGAGANAVVSGFFFDPTSTDFSIAASPGSQTVGQTRSTSYTATVTPLLGFNGSVTFNVTGLPAGATASFNPPSVSGGSSTTMTLIAGAATPTGTYNVTITGSSGSLTHSTSVTLVVAVSVVDTQTQGTWKGVYGADGFSIANDVSNYPGYAQVALSGQQSTTWVASTTDVRALQKGAPGATDRIASTWVSNSSFNIDINFLDGNSHPVGFYCLDWDARNRAERFDIIDLASGTVLDSRTVSGFSNGQYLIWNLHGNVRVRVTLTGGDNAVVSGIFFN